MLIMLEAIENGLVMGRTLFFYYYLKNIENILC